MILESAVLFDQQLCLLALPRRSGLSRSQVGGQARRCLEPELYPPQARPGLVTAP